MKQNLPPFPRELMAQRSGLLEVIINEAGTVDSALMRLGMNPRYDQTVLSVAKDWTYYPATVDGRPVKYRKVINISVKPPSK
jgi:hypothetical protein